VSLGTGGRFSESATRRRRERSGTPTFPSDSLSRRGFFPFIHLHHEEPGPTTEAAQSHGEPPSEPSLGGGINTTAHATASELEQIRKVRDETTRLGRSHGRSDWL
jgi:hypothetical protein